MSDSLLKVGEILRPVGLKGEMKVRPLTDDPTRFYKLKTVTLSGRPYKIGAVRLTGGFVFIRLVGIDSVETAESFRGSFLEVDRVHAVPLEEGRYFIADIIDCAVYLDTGVYIGQVTDVMGAAGADVFTVKGERTVRFPFLKKLAPDVDTDKKRITLSAAVFDEVSVYED